MINKEYPLVSVVMLNYNGLHYLKSTIPQVLNLHYKNIEFIIVDNGSVDGSIEFIKKFKEIKLIENHSNLGYSAGKNIGIKNAVGDYLLNIDEDILIKDKDLLLKLINEYTPDTGFLQVPLVDLHQEKTFYYGTYYSVYGLNMHRPPVSIQKILQQDKKNKICGPTGGFFFVSRKKMQKIGFFDEIQKFHLDDVDIGPRSWIFGFQNYLIKSAYCEHLGINKTLQLDSYINRYRLIFSGHARAMIKNFNLMDLILRLPILFVFHFIKAIKFSVKKRSFQIFLAFVDSVLFFIKNIPGTLKERRKIQSSRIVKEDVFLSIKPPRFI